MTEILESNLVIETITKFDEFCYNIHRRVHETVRRTSKINETDLMKSIVLKFSELKERYGRMEIGKTFISKYYDSYNRKQYYTRRKINSWR